MRRKKSNGTMAKPIATCRTIIDALGLQIEPKELAVFVERANGAYSIANYDDYHNQLQFIKKLIGREEE